MLEPFETLEERQTLIPKTWPTLVLRMLCSVAVSYLEYMKLPTILIILLLSHVDQYSTF